MNDFLQKIHIAQQQLDENRWLAGALAAGMLAASPITMAANTRSTPAQTKIEQSIIPNDRIAHYYHDDIAIVAKTLWGEAGNQTFEDKRAVATVIYNRAIGQKRDFKSVCLNPGKFSHWNNPRKFVNNYDERKSYAECVRIAYTMYTGSFKPFDFNPPIFEPHYYCTIEKYNNNLPDIKGGTKWINIAKEFKYMIPRQVVGGHIFFDFGPDGPSEAKYNRLRALKKRLDTDPMKSREAVVSKVNSLRKGTTRP